MTISAAFLLAATVVEAPSASLPAWMAGCWMEQSGAGWTEECWTRPRAGLMLGSSRSGTGETLREWEVLVIEYVAGTDGAPSRLVYRAAPFGRGWTTFVQADARQDGVAFINSAHDYPQRIRYWREGRLLKAEIAMLDGSRARQWTYEPIPAPK